MDVELPNGTVIQDVPDGMSKADLVTKLKANGMQVPDEWMAQQPEQRSALGNVAHGALGGLELAGSAVSNIPGGLVNAATDLASRATGNGEYKPVPTVPVGQAGQDVLGAFKRALPSTPNGLDISDKELRETIDPTGKIPIEQLRAQYAEERGKPLTQSVQEAGYGKTAAALGIGEDLAALYPALKSAGAMLSAGKAASAAMPLWREAGFKSPELAAADAVGFRNGFKAGSKQSLAVATAGGGEARAVLTNNNIDVGNVIARHAAGLPQDANTALTYETLARAAEPAEEVYRRAASGLPNGQAVLQRLKEARHDGFAGLSSDDPEAIARGRQALAEADALERHIEERITPYSGTSLEQFKAARKALAQNYAVRDALQGTDLDLAKLGRMYKAAPQKFSGGLKIAGEFATDNGAVVGRRINLADTAIRSELAGRFNLTEPGTWLRLAKHTGLPQRALVRGGGANTARIMFPGRDPQELATQPMRGLLQPPGEAWGAPQQGEMALPQRPLPQPPLLSETPGPSFETHQRELPFPMPGTEPPGLSRRIPRALQPLPPEAGPGSQIGANF